MSIAFEWTRAEFKQAQRDPMLGIMVLVPFLAGGGIRMALAIGTPILEARFRFDLSPWLPFVTAILVQLPGMMLGAIAGFALLDEREERLVSVWTATPSGRLGYGFLRFGLPCLAALVLAPLGVMAAGTPGMGYSSIPFIAAAALCAPAVAAIMGANATNKLEGLAISKALGVIALAPLLLLAPDRWHWVGWALPQYWIAAGFMQTGTTRLLAAGLALGTALGWSLLYSLRFLRRRD